MYKLKLPLVSFFFILFSSICYGADYLPNEGGDIEPPPPASIDMYISLMFLVGMLIILYFKSNMNFKN
jgi:hypothetical protein